MEGDQIIKDYQSSFIPGDYQGSFFAAYPLEDFSADNAALSAIYCRRDFYKVILIRGNATYLYDDKQEKLDQEKFTLIFSNRNSRYRWDIHSGECQGFGCIFNEEFLNLFNYRRSAELSVFSLDGQSFFRLNNSNTNFFFDLFKKMISEQESSYRDKYELLFLYLMEIIHGAVRITVPVEIKEKSASTRLYAAFLNVLSGQFPITSPKQQLKLRSAQDYANTLNVHVNYLNRSLKEITGKTTTRLLNERIMLEARALLLHTDLSVSQIGFTLGFEEPTHFTYFFRKHAGVTPSDIRQV